jgi:hypothetical protein
MSSRAWSSPCSRSRPPFQNRHQLEVEDQVVAGERMVGIERDVPLGQRRHYHLQRPPVWPLHVQMLAHRGVEIRGQLVPLDLQDARGLMRAIGVRCRNGDGFRCLCSHA